MTTPADLYYSVAGGGSGTSSGSPTTFAAALGTFSAAVPLEPGSYTLHDAISGTYAFLTQPSFNSRNWAASTLTITALAASIYDGTPTAGGRNPEFLALGNGARLAITANGATFQSWEAVLRCSRDGSGTLNNANVKNCTRVLSLGEGGHGQAVNGDWDGRDTNGVVITDSVGLLCVIGSTYDLQQPSNYTGLKIHHFDRGVVLSEGSSGHLDYMRIENCDVGVDIGRGAGSPNMQPIRFKNCAVGIRTEVWPLQITSDDTEWSNTFALGTADECGVPVMWTSGGIVDGIEGGGYDSRPSWQINSFPEQVAVTATTTTGLFAPCYVMAKGPRQGDTMKVTQNLVFAGTLNAAATFKFTTHSGALPVVDMAVVSIPTGTAYCTVVAELFWQNTTDVSGGVWAHCVDSTGLVKVLYQAIVSASPGTGYGAFSNTVSTRVNSSLKLNASGNSFQLRHATCDSTVGAVRF